MLSWRLLSHNTFLELGIAFPVEVYSSLCSSTNLEDGSFRLSPTGCRALFISLCSSTDLENEAIDSPLLTRAEKPQVELDSASLKQSTPIRSC
jgi:hypothetical protein